MVGSETLVGVGDCITIGAVFVPVAGGVIAIGEDVGVSDSVEMGVADGDIGVGTFCCSGVRVETVITTVGVIGDADSSVVAGKSLSISAVTVGAVPSFDSSSVALLQATAPMVVIRPRVSSRTPRMNDARVCVEKGLATSSIIHQSRTWSS